MRSRRTGSACITTERSRHEPLRGRRATNDSVRFAFHLSKVSRSIPLATTDRALPHVKTFEHYVTNNTVALGNMVDMPDFVRLSLCRGHRSADIEIAVYQYPFVISGLQTTLADHLVG
jgi:hypothetical protein